MRRAEARWQSSEEARSQEWDRVPGPKLPTQVQSEEMFPFAQLPIPDYEAAKLKRCMLEVAASCSGRRTLGYAGLPRKGDTEGLSVCGDLEESFGLLSGELSPEVRPCVAALNVMLRQEFWPARHWTLLSIFQLYPGGNAIELEFDSMPEVLFFGKAMLTMREPLKSFSLSCEVDGALRVALPTGKTSFEVVEGECLVLVSAL